MANIIDLSIMYKEAQIVKISEKESFEIPGNIPTDFTFELMAYVGKVNDIEKGIKSTEDITVIIEKSKELIELLKEIVLMIIKLDVEKKDITIDYINKNLGNIEQLKAILGIAMNHIRGIEQNPN